MRYREMAEDVMAGGSGGGVKVKEDDEDDEDEDEDDDDDCVNGSTGRNER